MHIAVLLHPEMQTENHQCQDSNLLVSWIQAKTIEVSFLARREVSQSIVTKLQIYSYMNTKIFQPSFAYEGNKAVHKQTFVMKYAFMWRQRHFDVLGIQPINCHYSLSFINCAFMQSNIFWRIARGKRNISSWFYCVIISKIYRQFIVLFYLVTVFKITWLILHLNQLRSFSF